MRKKLLEFDDTLRNEISTSSLAFYPDENKHILDTLRCLGAVIDKPDIHTCPDIPPEIVDTLCQVLERWPLIQRFPVIDLARLVLAYSPSAYGDTALRSRLVMSMFQGAEWQLAWTPPIPRPRDTNNMLVMRGLANLFENERAKDSELIAFVFERLGEAPYAAFSRHARQAMVTLIFNLSVITLRDRLDDSIRNNQVTVTLSVLSQETSDPETVHRCLAAFGNILYTASVTSNPLSSSQIEQARVTLPHIPSSYAEDKQNKGPTVQELANTILASL